MLLLLVENQQAGIFHRCEDRRARTDHDAGLTARDAPPLVIAFAHAQTGMEHGDSLSKVRRHFMQQLRRQRNFRHEQHGGAARVQRAPDQREIDRGLAAARHAVEKRRAGLFLHHLPVQAVKGGLLLFAQRQRACGRDILALRAAQAFLLIRFDQAELCEARNGLHARAGQLAQLAAGARTDGTQQAQQRGL